MAGVTVAVLTDAGGAHLSAYFAGLAAIAEVEKVVLGDPSGANEAAARKALGEKLVRVERTHAAAVSDGPPLAVVSLEAVQSPPAIRTALEAGCHVMAEKPGCVKAEDFVALARLADMKHRHLMLALANRLRTTAIAAKKMIAEGRIGTFYGCEVHIVADQTRLKSPSYHKSWFADRARSGGGHLAWLGIHWIDLTAFVTGRTYADVTGFAGIVGGQPLKIEDSAAMAVRFDNGAFGTITSGYYLDKGYHSHIKIWGSHGWIQLEPHGREPFVWYSTKDEKPEVHRETAPADDGGYTALLRACVRSAAGLEPPPLTTADSLHAVRTLFACYQAAESGRVTHVG